MEIKVINLDSRPDRWKEVQEELNNNGFQGYQRFSALTGGDKGCMHSHIDCMRGEGDIFIFEDDVIFIEDFEYWWHRCFQELDPNFDLLYLGANVKTPAVKYSPHLWRVTEGVHCTHAMFYSAKGRKLFNEHVPDILKCGLIDHWFYLYGLKILEAYVCNPLLAFQRPSYSDVRMQWFDYRGEMIENAKNNMQ